MRKKILITIDCLKYINNRSICVKRFFKITNWSFLKRLTRRKDEPHNEIVFNISADIMSYLYKIFTPKTVTLKIFDV